ncbi:hypothetical protein [Azohydromonas australica]|uniref:hypothetical protein n=1 Tax=Azohydromonas australica TaxID=364039 RepID=UPI0003FCAF54|nr:hypothetical protein [Azohydromonas australica]
MRFLSEQVSQTLGQPIDARGISLILMMENAKLPRWRCYVLESGSLCLLGASAKMLANDHVQKV